MEFETVCDLCGSSNFSLVYEGNIDEQVDSVIHFSSSRTQVQHWPIVKCLRCGLLRSNPRDDDQTLKKIYTLLIDEIYDSEEHNRAEIASERVVAINHISSPGKLLDIGCSTGLFTYEADKKGWQVTGVDASKWAINQAKTRCSGGHFFSSNIEDIEFGLEEFNIITLWDVLEHVVSPTAILNKINPWLEKDGWIILNVPNINSNIARMMKKHWVLLLREHLWYFSPETISQLLDKTGFEPKFIRPNRVKFTLKNIFSRLSQYSKFSWVQNLSRLPIASKLAYKFPMGEIQIYAQKKSEEK